MDQLCAGEIKAGSVKKAHGYPVAGDYLEDIGRECSHIAALEVEVARKSPAACPGATGCMDCFKRALRRSPPRSTSALRQKAAGRADAPSGARGGIVGFVPAKGSDLHWAGDGEAFRPPAAVRQERLRNRRGQAARRRVREIERASVKASSCGRFGRGRA